MNIALLVKPDHDLIRRGSHSGIGDRMNPKIIGNIEYGIRALLSNIIRPVCLNWLIARNLQGKAGKIVSRLRLPVPAQYHAIVRFDLALPAPVPLGRPGNAGTIIGSTPDALLARISICPP